MCRCGSLSRLTEIPTQGGGDDVDAGDTDDGGDAVDGGDDVDMVMLLTVMMMMVVMMTTLLDTTFHDFVGDYSPTAY